MWVCACVPILKILQKRCVFKSRRPDSFVQLPSAAAGQRGMCVLTPAVVELTLAHEQTCKYALFLSQRNNNCLQSFNLPITCILTRPHSDSRQNFGLIFPRHGKAAKQVGIPSITTLRDTHSLNGWLMRWNGTEWIPRARSRLYWATEMAWPPHATASCPPSDSATHLTQTYMHKHTPAVLLSLFSILTRMLSNSGHRMVTSPQHSREQGKTRRSTSVSLSLVFTTETRRGTAHCSLYKKYRISMDRRTERWNAHTRLHSYLDRERHSCV